MLLLCSGERGAVWRRPIAHYMKPPYRCSLLRSRNRVGCAEPPSERAPGGFIQSPGGSKARTWRSSQQLPIELQSELDVASAICRSDGSKPRTTEGLIRSKEVHVVKGIVHFTAELNAQPLCRMPHFSSPKSQSLIPGARKFGM